MSKDHHGGVSTGLVEELAAVNLLMSDLEDLRLALKAQEQLAIGPRGMGDNLLSEAAGGELSARRRAWKSVERWRLICESREWNR